MLRIRNSSVKTLVLLLAAALMLLAAGCGKDAEPAGGADAGTSGSGVSLAEAKEIALRDAGVSAADATFIKEKTDLEDGVQVYELEFHTSDGEYEYEIVVSDGRVFSREIERYARPAPLDPAGAVPEQSATAVATPAPAQQPETSATQAPVQSPTVSATPAPASAPTQAPTSSEISLEQAKEIALRDAGVSAAEATFTKGTTDREDGVRVYELEFYTAGAEYEYEIRVSDGSIYSKDVETFTTSGPGPSGGGLITLEQAKSIALGHANAGESSVTFKEAKLDRDDGINVYEIEFYFSGREYEYKIRASDGSILEYDVD